MENTSFVNLVEAIIAELGIDKTRKRIIVRYVVNGNSSAITIKNDIGVKLYIEVKKSEPRFGKYPLCMDTAVLEVDDTTMFDGVNDSIVCAEVTQHDADVISSLKIENGDYCFEHGVEVSNMFSMTTSVEVNERQLYKNKATLVAIMTKYKIEKRCNFKVKRLSRKGMNTIDFNFGYN